jgi:branched-chain amino acid transport system ATP-binding protein
MSTLLRLTSIEAGYRDLVAVHDVSLEVRVGEAVALIGGNGAGKTTTLRAISGLLPLRRGRIELEGERIDGRAPSQVVARGIAHVPEGRHLFPTMTVRENLELGARDRAGRAAGLDGVFALFPRLRERQRQLAGTLSGGEQQMCAIGRGLKHIFQVLATINTSGTSILLVEQNVARALALAHRAYVVENGRIVLEGPRAALQQSAHVKQAYLGL